MASLSDDLSSAARRSNGLTLELADDAGAAPVIELWSLPTRLVHRVLLNGEFLPPEFERQLQPLLAGRRVDRLATGWWLSRSGQAVSRSCLGLLSLCAGLLELARSEVMSSLADELPASQASFLPTSRAIAGAALVVVITSAAAGLPASQDGEPGQVRKEAATAV